MNQEFVEVAAKAAGRVAETMTARPFRAGEDYDPRPVVAAAGEALAAMRGAMATLEGPMVLGRTAGSTPSGWTRRA